MSFKVLQAGIYTLMQDLGRMGYMSQAISQGGPVDERPFKWNNQLLANHPNNAQIEIHQGMLKLQATTKMTIAHCGHGSDLWINQNQVANWCTHTINQNDTLYFKPNGKGQVSYLAVKGGFNQAEILGSQATTPRLNLGFNNGKTLQKNDELQIAKQIEHSIPCSFGLKCNDIPHYQRFAKVRCIIGNTNAVPQIIRDNFFNNKHYLSNQKDRMGIRFKEQKTSIPAKSNSLYSEGLVKGTIQLLPTGAPLVLGPDAQTIGGYLKLGSVFSLDLGILYQNDQDSAIEFEAITVEQAQQLKREFQQSLQHYNPYN